MPALPVVLGVAVLERGEREAVGEVAVEPGHLVRRELTPLEAVATVGEELARRRIERDRHLLAMPGPLGCVEDRADRGLARVEVGREAALVTHRGREPSLREQLLQLVVRLRRDPQRLGEAPRARGDDHELLQVDRVVGVDAAVDHVQHRHRQPHDAVGTEVSEERDPLIGGRCLRSRKRDAEDRVRAEPALVRRPVELDHGAVEPGLVEGVATTDRIGDLPVDVGDRLGDALAAVGVAAVAELDRFVHPRRCPRRHRGAAKRAGIEVNVDLDGRIPSRVEDLARVDAFDRAHASVSLARSK